MATDRQLELALRVQADFKRARTELHGLQREIKQVGTSSEQAAAGSKTQAAAISEQGKAARATTQALNAQAAGERKRFADLIHNAKTIEESERSIAERRSEAAGAAQALTQAQREASVARARAAAVDRAAVKARMADYAVLDKILSGHVKTQDELAAAEVVLDRLQKQGAINAAELTAAFAALNKITEKNTAANVANAASRRAGNSRMYSEIGTAASEVAAGNFGRLRRTGAAFLNQSGFFTQLLTTRGLAITGSVAALAVLTLAYKHATDEIQAIDDAIVRSGNVAGVTTVEIEEMAGALDHVSHSTAAKTLIQIINSGQSVAGQLREIAQAAINLATLTDSSVEDATTKILAMMKSPAKGVEEFDQSLNFLTTAQLQEIQHLDAMGNHADAAKLALDALSKSVEDGATKIRENMPWYDRLFSHDKQFYSNLFSGLGQALIPESQKPGVQQFRDAKLAYQQQLKAYELAKKEGASQSYLADLMENRVVPAYQKAIALYNKYDIGHLNEKNAVTAIQKQIQEDGKSAIRELTQLGISLDGVLTKQEKVNKAASELYKIYLAGGKLPEGVNFNGPFADVPTGPGWDRIKKQLLGPQKHDHAAERAANAATKAAAQDNQQLRDTFIQLQAAQDPTAAAWARYNEVVGKANQRVTEAKAKLDALVAAGKLSRAEADRRIAVNKGLADGIEYMARKTRQAAIDKLADADREAWEKLKASLRTPAEVAADNAIAKLKELKRLMQAADSGMSQRQHDRAAQAAVAGAFRGGTQLRRVRNEGPGGDILDLQSQEQTDFAARMAYLQHVRDAILQSDNATHQQRLDAQRAYQEQSKALLREHIANQRALEMQKANFALSTAQQGFGALAQATAQAYGQQSTAARAAFALQKTAAVASATLSIEESIANSAKLGYPWNVVAIAGAIAQGAALLTSLESVQPGYAQGGHIRGPGTGTSDSITIRASDGEYMQRAAAVQYYGVDFMDALNGLRVPRFAAGGLISGPAAFANMPSPADLGISASTMPRMRLPDAAHESATRAQPQDIKVVVVSNMEQAAIEAMNSPAGQKVIVRTTGDNPNAIKGRWGS